MLGIATGVLFALSAALTKAVVDALDDGIFTIFTTWHLYGLVVIGYASMALACAVTSRAEDRAGRR